MITAFLTHSFSNIPKAANVRFGSLADMATSPRDVRFTPIPDMRRTTWHVRFVPLTEDQQESQQRNSLTANVTKSPGARPGTGTRRGFHRRDGHATKHLRYAPSQLRSVSATT